MEDDADEMRADGAPAFWVEMFLRFLTKSGNGVAFFK